MNRKDPCKIRLRSGLTALALTLLLLLFISCSKAKPKVILEPPPQIPAYSWLENPSGGACLDEAGLAALNVELDLLYERTKYLNQVAHDLGATDK